MKLKATIFKEDGKYLTEEIINISGEWFREVTGVINPCMSMKIAKQHPDIKQLQKLYWESHIVLTDINGWGVYGDNRPMLLFPLGESPV